jgi:zinc transporter ZupT
MLSTFSIHRGQLASKEAEERPQVERFYTRSKPRGGEVTVLAGGTSAEELIEGLSIGVGAVIKPGFALLIALAIIIDNLAESLSIGEIIRSERDGHKRREVWRILGWSGLIGFALLISALTLGGFFLKGLSEPVLGFLFGLGGGGILYPTISDLLPDAEERHINNRRRLRWQTDSYLSLYFSSSCEDTMDETLSVAPSHLYRCASCTRWVTLSAGTLQSTRLTSLTIGFSVAIGSIT